MGAAGVTGEEDTEATNVIELLRLSLLLVCGLRYHKDVKIITESSWHHS